MFLFLVLLVAPSFGADEAERPDTEEDDELDMVREPLR